MKTIVILLLLASMVAAVMAAGDDDVFEWRPEIHHVFKEPERMPPTWFSQLFTAITLAPWLVLTIGWFGLGVNPVKVAGELVSGSSIRAISIVTFLATLVAIEYLFYLYWTRLNIFETLTYFVPLAIITFITGQRALSQVQARRKSTA